MKKEQLTILKPILTLGATYLSGKFGLLYPIFLMLLILMVADYFSGMAAARKEALDNPENPELGWSSKKGKRGILKKFGYIVVIGVAMITDYIIFQVAETVGIGMPGTTFFGLLTAIWFILNESLSVLENAGRMGAPMPEYLTSVISVLKESVEQKGSE